MSFPRFFVGDKFGRWTVIEESFSVKHKVKCVCVCGNYGLVRGSSLRNKHSQSCGCYMADIAREVSTHHGGAINNEKHPLYNVWANMKARCLNKNHESFHRYGGRGIRIQLNWLSSFGDFRDYISNLSRFNERESHGLTLDRIDNNGSYVEGNLRWATKSEQQTNREVTREPDKI